MGKKTSSRTIYQKNKLNIWNVKYNEKKNNESNLYSCIYLEINKFVKKILKDNGFLLNCCKISFSESKLRLFVSYVVSLHALKIPKSYPQILKSNLFQENRKDKLSKSFRNKIDFTSRIKKFLVSKISLSEKKRSKIMFKYKTKDGTDTWF